MTIFYTFLAAITVAVVVIVIGAGKHEHAQKPIAGGYDAAGPGARRGAPPPPASGAPLPATAPASAAVLGPSFDVKQSGEFVNWSNPQGTLSGKLRIEGGAGSGDGPRKLTGDVNCVSGKTQHFVGTVTPGAKTAIAGKLAGVAMVATLRRAPPDAGAPKPRAPGNIAGPYKLSPRSTCFGGTIELEGSGSKYTAVAKTGDLGELTYNSETGLLTGDLACKRGGTARFKASAVDRNLTNATVIPLDVAT